jgi:DNA-binding Xre family transcriptional regulator
METVPHIGNRLRQFVQQRRIFQSGWARKQGITEQTIARYLKQPTMRVDTLFAICLTLKYNFIREIADALPAELEPRAVPDQTAQVAAQEQRIAQLETQVATLKEALALVGGRGN